MSINLRELAPTANETIPDFNPGDTVRVDVRVVEGDRERIQAFEGVVIRIRKSASTFTVRRISSGVGVERTFPFNGSRIAGVGAPILVLTALPTAPVACRPASV